MALRLVALVLRSFLARLPPPIAAWLKSMFGPAWEHLQRRRGTSRNPTELLPAHAPTQVVRIERFAKALADLDAEELRSTVTSLNDQAEELGCVIFEGHPEADGAAVIFAGNVERFFMLPVARHLACKVVYLQDLQSGWYQGSRVLPDLPALCRTLLREEIGQRPCLFFGQSSGAYAALAASATFPDAAAVACAPQSFADAEMKSRVHFVGIRCLQTPSGLLDLKSELSKGMSEQALHAIVIAASEAANPYTAHYWMDYLHALRLIELPSVHLSVIKADNHAIVHGRLNQFAELLQSLMTEPFAPRTEKMAMIDRFLQRSFS